MTKAEFNKCLRRRLAGLSAADMASTLEYYNEMIDDRMEEGLPEADAVETLGSVDEIVRTVLAETPLPERSGLRRFLPAWAASGWVIALLILGLPVWLPLLGGAAVVFFAVFLVLWVMVACLWVMDLCLVAAGAAGIFAAVAGGSGPVWNLGCGLVCLGLAAAFFLVCVLSVRGVAALEKWLLRGMFGKRCKV